jgi:hypothetical protein
MGKLSITKLAVVFFLVNLIAITSSIISGYQRGKIAYRFEEKQAMTFFSSNQLAATSLLAWLTYLIRRRLLRKDPAANRISFWVISATGFFYLMLDESFQIHEGIDKNVSDAFGGHGDPMLDGVVTASYGIVAAAVCWYYRSEILRYPCALRYFILGGIFLALTSALDIGEETQLQIVAEESCKILGVVSFLVGHFAALLGSLDEIEKTSAIPSGPQFS